MGHEGRFGGSGEKPHPHSEYALQMRFHLLISRWRGRRRRSWRHWRWLKGREHRHLPWCQCTIHNHCQAIAKQHVPMIQHVLPRWPPMPLHTECDSSCVASHYAISQRLIVDVHVPRCFEQQRPSCVSRTVTARERRPLRHRSHISIAYKTQDRWHDMRQDRRQDSGGMT